MKITKWQLNKIREIEAKIIKTIETEDAEYGYHIVLDEIEELNNILNDIEKETE